MSNDAGFRQFGRPEVATRKTIDTELLNYVLNMELHVQLAKNYLYEGDVEGAKDMLTKLSQDNINFQNTLIRRRIEGA